jgi:hypothetical protein
MIKHGNATLLSRLLPTILSFIAVLCVAQFVGCGDVSKESPEIKPGYYHGEYEGMTPQGAAFLACGTGGRLDRIFEDGTLANIPLPVGDKTLTSLLVGGDITLVGGESGALAFSRDGEEFELSTGLGNEQITGLAQFNGKYYACTYSGKIFSSVDGASWETDKRLIDKPLAAVAANSSYILAVTGDTDIFRSEDGVEWDSWNYNEFYDGLTKKLSFSNLVCRGETFYLLGYPPETPEYPTIMFSSDGDMESWREIVSIELNKRSPYEFYPLTVFSVSSFGDYLLAACDRGRILTYTDCPSCNTIAEVSDSDLRCVAVSDGDAIFAAGENFEFSKNSSIDIPGNRNHIVVSIARALNFGQMT